MRTLSKKTIQKLYTNFNFTATGFLFLFMAMGLFYLGFQKGNAGFISLSFLLFFSLIFSYFGLNISLYFVKVYWIKKESYANKRQFDTFTLHNFSPFPLYQLKIYEKYQSKSYLRLEIPLLLPFEKRNFNELTPFLKRGEYRWDEVYLQSRFPLGLFVKKKKIADSGKRYVWPEPLLSQLSTSVAHAQSDASNKNQKEVLRSKKTGLPIGSARAYLAGDSASMIHWKKSVQLGKLMVLEKEAEARSIEFSLDLSKISSQTHLEKEVSEIAFKTLSIIHQKKEHEPAEIRLKVYENGKMRAIYGFRNVMDLLSVVQVKVPNKGQIHEAS